MDFANEVDGAIGRVRVTRLGAKGEIIPLVDAGEDPAIGDRYHLVIDSPKGTLLRAGSETVVMQENQLWWFNNKARHRVVNPGEVPGVHLIFDLLRKA